MSALGKRTLSIRKLLDSDLWLFDVSCGFENGTCWACDHVDHGDEGPGVAVAPGSRPGGLEQAVQTLHAGIGVS